MTENVTKKGMTEQQETIISGMGAYSTHKEIPYNEWQANRMIAKQKQNKVKTSRQTHCQRIYGWK